MRLIKGLQRRRLTAIALVIACLTVGGLAFWHASKLPAQASSSKDQQLSLLRLHRGLGSEVRFASSDANPQQIDESVASTADFIYWRSGLRMSDETKERLVEAETNALNGKTQRLTLGELTDKLTASVTDRLATITDEEISWAAEVSSDKHGDIQSRADGKWGVLTKAELIQQAKSGRAWSQRGDAALRTGLRSMIEEEVMDRAGKLGAALPEQFGRASEQGITPTQALIIAYSVAADDPLTDSRSDIEQLIIQQRINDGVTREQRKAQKNVSGRPYGPRGMMHPSAPGLFFNKAAIESLLNGSEGGGK